MAKCKICGAAGKACGGPSSVHPLDTRATGEGNGVMGLKRYNVESTVRRGSLPTIMQLNEADAERMGLTDADLYDPKAKADKPSGSSSSTPARARAPRKRASKAAAKPANKAGAADADKGTDAGAAGSGM